MCTVGTNYYQHRASRTFKAVIALAAISTQVSAGTLGPDTDASFGCKVLMCLAVPAGWSTVAYCVPPVRQLLYDLSKGRGFPNCEAAEQGVVKKVKRSFELCAPPYREPTDLGLPDPEDSVRPSSEAGGTNGWMADPKLCYGKYKGRKFVPGDDGVGRFVDDYDNYQAIFYGPQTVYEIYQGDRVVQRIFTSVALRGR